MKLESEQSAIIWRMAVSAAVATGLLVIGPVLHWLPAYPDENWQRLETAAIAILIVSTTLLFAIARLARHRFFSEHDLDPAATADSDAAQAMQKMLQNTLEQVVLASLAYAVWSILVPSDWGVVPLVAAIMFVAARVLFFAGYAKGAAARAFGFTLCFYPSIAILLGSGLAALSL